MNYSLFTIFITLCIVFNLLFPDLFVLISNKLETDHFVSGIKAPNDTNCIITINDTVAVRLYDQTKRNVAFQIDRSSFFPIQTHQNEAVAQQMNASNIFRNVSINSNLTIYTNSNSIYVINQHSATCSRMTERILGSSSIIISSKDIIDHLLSNDNEANMKQIQTTSSSIIIGSSRDKHHLSHQNNKGFHFYSGSYFKSIHRHSQTMSFCLLILSSIFGVVQNTKTNGIILLSIATILSLWQYPCCVNAANWTLVTSPPIPNNDIHRVIGYDSNKDLVWMLGGYWNTRQIISFNIINKTYIDYGAILTADITAQTENYVQKDNILYIVYGYNLYKYDLTTNIALNLQTLSSQSIDGTNGCLAVVDNYLILTYLLDLYIYNINSNTWTTPSSDTPSMTNTRRVHSCQVSTAKHLYVIGGRDLDGLSIHNIEKLDLSDMSNIKNYNWMLLRSTLSAGKELASSVIFNDFIYYIQNGVHVVDTKNDIVTSFNSIYEPVYGAAAVMISETIYLFGGWDSNINYKTYYQYFHLTTDSPTSSPTYSPSISPSNSPTSSCIDYNDEYSNDGNDETNFNHKNVINMDRYHQIINNENTMKFVPSPNNLDVKCVDNDCLIICNKSTSCFLSNIDISNSTNRSIVVLCNAEFACSKTMVSTKSVVSMTNISIICSDKYSCINMKVNVKNISSMHIYCIEYQSCFDLTVNIDINNNDRKNMTLNETNDGIVSCVSLNSCDNLLITTNSNKTQLFMYQHSEDVILNNGIGYLYEQQNIICNTDRYIRYETNYSSAIRISNYRYLSTLILNEYDNTNPLLPCDDVSVECGNYSCNMVYAMNIPSDLHSLSNGCYWIPVQQLLEIKCDGECITSPTKSPIRSPSNIPSASTSNPTNAATQSPSIAPSDNNKDILTISSDNQDEHESFIAIYISICILSSGLLISCLVLFINKKENSIIDNAKWMTPFLFSFQIYDLFTDINLSYDILTNPLSYQGNNKINIIFCCGIFSLIFTVVPYTTNLFYGIRIKKQKIIAQNNRADTFFTDRINIAVLIGLIIISGGCYPALLLTSSRIFNLDVFTSGLTKYELNKLIKIKIKSTITMENGPQLLVQIVYGLLTTFRSSAVFLAFLGSVLSVIMAIASFYVNNKLSLKDSQFISYYLQFKNNKNLTLEQTQNIEKNKERKEALQKSIATQFNISYENIEIGYSTLINKGLEMRIIQFIPQSVKPNGYLMEMYKQYSNEINIVFRNHFDIDHDEDKFVVSFVISTENNRNEKQLSNKQDQVIKMMTKHHLSSVNRTSNHQKFTQINNNDDNDDNNNSMIETMDSYQRESNQQFSEINEKLMFIMNHMGIDNNDWKSRKRDDDEKDGLKDDTNWNDDDIDA